MAVRESGGRYNGAMTRAREYPGTLTARQFAKAAERLNVTPATLASARRVLVDGKTVQEVAESDGVTIDMIYHGIYAIRPLANAKLGHWPRRYWGR